MLTSCLRSLFACLVLGLLVSCASGLKMGPDGLRFEVTDAQLQREIDKAGGFPIKKGVGLGNLQAMQASLLLIPADNSLGLSVPVRVESILKSWKGQIAFSATPVFEKETGIIYLTNFVLREVQVPGLPSEIAQISATAVTAVLRETVKRYDVYRLDGSKWGEGMAKLALKDIQVKSNAVAFRLGM
jgi:hypothetical protein